MPHRHLDQLDGVLVTEPDGGLDELRLRPRAGRLLAGARGGTLLAAGPGLDGGTGLGRGQVRLPVQVLRQVLAQQPDGGRGGDRVDQRDREVRPRPGEEPGALGDEVVERRQAVEAVRGPLGRALATRPGARVAGRPVTEALGQLGALQLVVGGRRQRANRVRGTDHAVRQRPRHARQQPGPPAGQHVRPGCQRELTLEHARPVGHPAEVAERRRPVVLVVRRQHPAGLRHIVVAPVAQVPLDPGRHRVGVAHAGQRLRRHRRVVHEGPSVLVPHVPQPAECLAHRVVVAHGCHWTSPQQVDRDAVAVKSSRPDDP